jgi:hypothetical protein
VTSSVSGNDIGRFCFRILGMSCDVLSANVHGSMSLLRPVVIQLLTRSSTHHELTARLVDLWVPDSCQCD